MFFFRKKKILTNAILNLCDAKIGIYEEGVQRCLDVFSSHEKADNETQLELLTQVRKDYLNAVFDAIWDGIRERDPSADTRVRLSIFDLQITGLPQKFTAEYLNKNGISAGVAFAIFYYAITGKEINIMKDAKTLSTLNHYQDDLMNKVLDNFQ